MHEADGVIRLNLEELDQLVMVQDKEPVPHVPQRNPGGLGNPAVVDESLRIALGTEDRLGDHTLSPEDTSHDLPPRHFLASKYSRADRPGIIPWRLVFFYQRPRP